MKAPRFFSLAADEAGKPAGKPDGVIKCLLCSGRCVLAPGKAGRCRVRFNREGKPDIPFYGFVTSLALDPIEKKPLYHFRPGTEILSAGFAGCNLRCPFCQNWHISQTTDAAGRFFTPAELAGAAAHAAEETAARADNGAATDAVSVAIAYTYSEPLVHIEFLLDCMKEARKAGTANVLVSNGCVNPEAAGEVLDLCDAANIDLKCFSEKTYEEVLGGGDFKAVLNFIRAAVDKGVHLEITTLVVPGLNDSRKELDKCRDFIAELCGGGKAVPWHLSAYHPEWKWREPATENSFLATAAQRAREKLKFVYSGNVPAENGFNDTACPHCGKVLIQRRGYHTNTAGLSLKTEKSRKAGHNPPAYFCASCGKPAPVRW